MSLFLDVALGKDTARAPVWIMRQAGRYLPEYRAVKERYGFFEMCRNPEAVTEVTLQPVRRFDLDAAILFSDIMIPLAAMGVDIDFAPGPVIAHSLRNAADVARLRVPDQEEIAPFVAAAIPMVREAAHVPLIGFAGAPLTLAAYLVESGGSGDGFPAFRSWLHQQPTAAHALLGKLTEVTIRYLRMQVAAGADAIQLFDSWAGVHPSAVYARFGQPYAARVLAGIGDLSVPRIHFGTNTHHLLGQLATLPAEVIGVDWRAPLSAVRPALPGKTLQGNLDPAVLTADPDLITELAHDVLRHGIGGPHIFNLGHGIRPDVPPDHVSHLIEAVRSFDRRQAATHRETR
ncbi:uroporphyrinogen decarboxylase [Streptomyces sp. NPDC054933]